MFKALAKVNLTKEFRIMSYNHDWNDKKFISSLEHVRYPFYGVQFHPEKILFEWVREKNISHTYNAIKANRYFADFFVNEGRYNFLIINILHLFYLGRYLSINNPLKFFFSSKKFSYLRKKERRKRSFDL